MKILMIFVKNSIIQLKKVVIKIDVWSHLSFNWKNIFFIYDEVSAWNSHQKWKKQIFIRKLKFFNEKIFFWPFFKCASFLYNLPWLLQSNTCSKSSIFQWFFKISPRRVKNVKKRFKRNKIKQIHSLNARVLKLNPNVGIPLGPNGIQFQHSSIQIVDLFDFVPHMPPSNSTDRSTNFSPVSLKNYFLNFE